MFYQQNVRIYLINRLLFILLVEELQACQQKKVFVKFNDDETKILSKKIKKLSYQLSQELKSIEKKINLYINSEFLDFNDDLMFQIKENISQFLLTELNSFSKKFKLNQEIYSQKCKELISDEDEYEMNDISTSNTELDDGNIKKDDQNFLMTKEPDLILQNRDNELNEIIRGVTNLKQMFKDLQIIVVEQGTILDRIDYNIEVGYDNVSKGKKKIVQANDKHKSSCFRNVILFLQVCIFVEAMLILFKFL